ncbi:methionine ABC transporter ATP-binding protein [Nocardioides sp. ChNu-99]|uniref:methionine ABC transporter ATP-binding protein n=1 Tax=Nocardioides sp. ChNu-99 TaxID=2839897 RepID=UPI0024061885|nr:methionine ABC transporter ATP-binding protein [Nocardioides sp. ChNu-99]MDF9717056.1 methionine ABC transporter ATP-binding protein [Nocardioides sp. ChNu-99]
MSVVQLTDVVKEFPGRGRRAPALRAVDGVSLTVEAGEIHAIVGYSGAGKSTLVRLVNALEEATSGSVVVNGTELVGLPEKQLRQVRRDIGMIFQQFNLFGSRTVWGNLAYPLTVAGVPKEEHQRRISELLHFVGLADKAHAYPDQLSGGQKQRVGIARALATEPKVLLADEATSALDPETTRDVLDLLRRVNRDLGVTILLITHEMEVVRQLAHTVSVMEEGRVVERGVVADVFADPTHPVTRRFVGTVVDDRPDDELLAVLRERHPGRFVRLAFRDADVRQTQVYDVLARHGVGFELVYGGIEAVGERTFANLTLALEGEPAAVQAAVDEVAGLVRLEEFA